MKLRNKFLSLIISFIIISSSIVSVGAVSSVSDRADALSRDLSLSSVSDHIFYTRDGIVPGFSRSDDNRDVVLTNEYMPFEPVHTRSNIVSWPINIVTPQGITSVPEFFNRDSWLKLTFYKFQRAADGQYFHSIMFTTLDADQNEVSFSYDLTSIQTQYFQGIAAFYGSSPTSLSPLFRSETNYGQPNYNITTSSDGTYAPVDSVIPAYINDRACVYFQATISGEDLAAYYNAGYSFYFFLIPTFSGNYSIRQWGTGNILNYYSYYNCIKDSYNFSATYNPSGSYGDPTYDFTFDVDFNVLDLDLTNSIQNDTYYVVTPSRPDIVQQLTSSSYKSVVLDVSGYEQYYISGTVGASSILSLVVFTDSRDIVLSRLFVGGSSNVTYIDKLVSVPRDAVKMYITSQSSAPQVKRLSYMFRPLPVSSVSYTFSDYYYALSNNQTSGPVFVQDKVNNKIRRSGSFPKYYLENVSDITCYVLSRSQYDTYVSSDSDQKTYDDIIDARDDYINASNELSEALEGFEELNKPDVSAVKDIIHSQQIDNAISGISSFSPIYQTIFDQDIVLEMLIISLTFVFIGYILFGKRS